MPNRKHLRFSEILVFGFAISTLAQGRVPTTQPAVHQQGQSLMQSGRDALAAGDASQARTTFNQLLELGRENSRLDLVWQAQHGLGRAALAAHDPLLAIEHLEQSAAAYEQSGDTSSEIRIDH